LFFFATAENSPAGSDKRASEALLVAKLQVIMYDETVSKCSKRDIYEKWILNDLARRQNLILQTVSCMEDKTGLSLPRAPECF